MPELGACTHHSLAKRHLPINSTTMMALISSWLRWRPVWLNHLHICIKFIILSQEFYFYDFQGKMKSLFWSLVSATSRSPMFNAQSWAMHNFVVVSLISLHDLGVVPLNIPLSYPQRCASRNSNHQSKNSDQILRWIDITMKAYNANSNHPE